MKKRNLYHYLLVPFLLFGFLQVNAQEGIIPPENPLEQLVVDVEDIRSWLLNAPKEGTADARTKFIIVELPMPNGLKMEFRAIETQVLSPELAARNPEIKTYRIISMGDGSIFGNLTASPRGIDALITTPEGNVYIEPVSFGDSSHYVYNEKDGSRFVHPTQDMQFEEGESITPEEEKNGVHKHSPDGPLHKHGKGDDGLLKAFSTGLSIGSELRTYNVHITCKPEYSDQHDGGAATVAAREANVLAVITAQVNSASLLYERDIAIRLLLTGTAIFVDAPEDINGNPVALFGSSTSLATEALEVYDQLDDDDPNIDWDGLDINSYDLGHVFGGTGGNGSAFVGVVCQSSFVNGVGPGKGGGGTQSSGASGSGWIELFSHEMGHQFSARHTFNGDSGNCDPAGGQHSFDNAVEPGSGVTIMSYRGICGADNIKEINSNANARVGFFGINSIETINDYITVGNSTGLGNCNGTVVTNNSVPVAMSDPCSSGTVTIPQRTPFELTGSATDADGDDLTYSWEQYDLGTPGDPGIGITENSGDGNAPAGFTEFGAPIFRPRDPMNTPTRQFPLYEKILLGGNLIDPTAVDGEILPIIDRTMTFRMTVRDGNGGVACVERSVMTSNNASAFEVTAPIAGITWVAGTPVTVTWNTGGFAGCNNVNILLSIDGGNNYAYTIASSVSYAATTWTGTLPSNIPNTTQARIRVECADFDCVKFFNISPADFDITSACLATSNSICPASSCTANSGSTDLNLGLIFTTGEVTTSKAVTVTSSSPSNTRGLSDTAGSTTCATNGTRNYEFFDFVVEADGTYSFGVSGGSFTVASIFDAAGFDPSNPCNSTFYGSNGFVNGGSASASSSFSATLTSCTVYRMMIYSSSPLPNNVTITVSGGSIIENITTLPADYSHTYLAVDNSNDQIVMVNSASNFIGLTAGSYTIYGAVYYSGGGPTPATVDPNDWVTDMESIADVLASGDCVVFSTNSKDLTVNTASGCGITGTGLTSVACNSNNTSGTGADDFIEFSLNPAGAGLGAFYTVTVSSGSVTPSTATYGSITNFQLQNGSAGSGNVTITITDGTDNSCDITDTVTDPGACSFPCAYTASGIADITCNDNGTVNDTSDDFITFTLNPTGTDLSSEYAVSVSAGSITPASATYGSVTTFQLQNGSAGGGNVTLTISDGTDAACSTMETVTDPGNCSMCQAASTYICPTTAVSATQGTAAANLNLTGYEGGVLTTKAINILTTDPHMDVVMNDGSGGCLNHTFQRHYGVVQFTVDQAGTYNVAESIAGFFVLNLFQGTFDPNDPCPTWIASSATDDDGTPFGGATGFSSVSAALTECTNYYFTISQYGSDSNFSGNLTFSGPGNVYEFENSLADYSFTYVAVNTANNQVAAVSASADFTSLAVGSYLVYGVSYHTSSVNTATWVGQTEASIEGADCAVFGDNNVSLTITAACTPPTVNAPTVTDPTCTIPTGTIVVNASGSGTLEYSINGGTSFQTSNTFSGLAPNSSHNIRVRLQANPTCFTDYASNPVTIGAIGPLPTLAATGNNPSTCSGTDGSIDFTFTNVPDGNYTITYSTGSFTGVTVTSNMATVPNLSAGTFNDLTITVGSCTTTQDVDITLSDPAIPTLAATGNNPTTCSGTDGSIDFTFTNVPDGNYTITYSTGSFTGVTVTSNMATIPNLSAGTFNDLTITVSGCTSTENVDITLSDPAIPTLAATGNNPTTCSGTDGSIDFTFTNVPDGNYTITYSTGSFTGVTVTSNMATVPNLSAGTYNDLTITVNGCTSTEDVDITLSDPAIPTLAAIGNNPSTCSGTDGTIDFTFTNVPDGNYTITYSTGSFTGVTVTSNMATVPNLGAGVYNDLTITVNGCTSTEDVDITLSDPAIPTLAATGNNPTTCIGTDGSIDFTFTNVPDGNYTITYSTGSFTGVTVTSNMATVPNLGAGTFNDLTITLNGCTSTEDVDITLSDPAIPTLAANGNNPSACNSNDGSIDFTFTNVPDGNYTITYSTGSFTGVTVTSNMATVPNLGAGTFNDLTITVNGCTSNEDVDIVLSAPAIPTLAATGNNPTTCSGTDGSIDFTFTNVPDGNYTITYSTGSFTGVTVTSNMATVPNLGAGVYNDLTITVSGCTSAEDVDITLSDPAIPTLAATGNNPTTCSGTDGSIDFTFTNVPDGNYTITYSAGSFTGVTVTSNMATVPNLGAGVYNDLTITVNGCTSTEDVDITLSDPAIPTLAATGNNPTTCSGTDGSIDFTFTNVPDGNYTITYSTGSFTGVTVTSNMATVPNLSAGTYNDLTITVSGCVSTEDVDITLSDPAIPTLAATGNNPTTCSGTDGTIDFTFTNVPDGNYTITYSTGSFTGVTVTSNMASVPNLSAGTYNDLTITVSGCTSTEDVDIILVEPNAPTLAATGNDPTTCGGTDGSIDFTFTNVPDGNYTITYSTGSFTGITVTSNMASVPNLSAGTYNDLTITVSGCTSAEDVDIILSDPAIPTLAATGNDPTTCGGTDGSIDFTFTNVPDGNYTITYSTGSFTGITVTSNMASVPNLGAGVYNDLTITVSGCTSTEDVDITLSDPAIPTLAATGNNPSTCSGTDGSIDFTFTNVPDGNYTITYSTGSFTGVTVTNNLATVGGLSAGIFNDLTITVSGCTSTEDIDITLSEPVNPTLAATGNDPSTCGGNDGSIDFTFTNVPDGNYTITYSTGSFTGVTVTNNMATVGGLSAGIFNDLTITVNNCTSTEDVDITLNNPPNPTLAATGNDPTTCNGTDGSIDFTFTNVPDGNYTITYSTGTFTGVTVTNNMATVGGLGAGTFNDLTITVNGCTSTEDVDITLTNPPTATLAATGNNPSACNSNDGSIDFTFTNVPDGNYTINYNGGSFTGVTVTGNMATVGGLGAGTFNDLTITVNGCTSIDDVDITLNEPNAPTLAAIGNDPTTCGGTDGSIDFTFTNVPDGNYTITYSTGSFTGVTVTNNMATVGGLSAGTFNDLTITVSGCTSAEDVDIVLSDPAIPTLAATGNDPTTCGGTDGSIDFTFTNVSDGNYTITYSTGSFTGVTVTNNLATVGGLSAGTFNDLIITVSGCTSTEDVDIVLSDPANPTLAATGNNPTTCGGSDGSIDFTFTNVPDGNYTITYGTGSFTGVTVANNMATVGGLSAGTFNDLIITVNGCSSVQDVDIVLSDPAIPTLAATGNNPSSCSGADGSIDFTFTNVPDGNYTITYSTGSFTGVTVTNNMATVSGLSAGTFNDLTITVSGCTSTEDIDIVLSDPAIPTLAATGNNPSSCGGTDGSIDFTFTNVPDGNYTINYSTGSFTGVTVTNNMATVGGLSAGTFSDLTITINNCTSTEDIDIILVEPNAPTLAATGNNPTTCGGSDGSIDFTFTNVPDGNYTITYSTGSFTSVAVTNNMATVGGLSAGTFNDLTITVNGCTSSQDVDIVLSDPAIPTLAATGNDPTTCSGTDGSIDFTFTNVPDGNYTITYNGGSFTGVTVTNNMTTVGGLSAGTFNDLTITVSGCISTEDVDIILSDPAIPTLAATGNNPTTCGGNNGSIDFMFTNVPDGTYTINYNGGSFTGVTVTNNLATINGLGAGTFNDLTITVSGCTSTEDVDITLAEPNAPTLAATGNDPTTCGGNDGSIDFTFTNVPDGNYTITYSTGSFTGVAVTNNMATVGGLSAGTFNDLTIMVGGCTSAQDVDITLVDPNVPTLAATGNNPTTCNGTDGSIDFTFTNVPDGNYTITYSTGSFTGVTVTNNMATVGGLSAGTFNDLTISVIGCASTEDVDIVLSDPTIPTLAATGNNPTTCNGTDGSIDFMFTNVPDGNYTITYSTGSFSGVTVTNNMATVGGLSAGTFNDLTITITGCISTEDVDIVLSDPAIPTLAATGNNPTTCNGTDGSIDFTFTNVPDGNYTITYSTGSFTSVTVTNNMATVGGLSAGVFNDLTITVNNCTSIEDVDVTLTDPAIPTIAATGNNPTTCNGTNGSIDFMFTNVADGNYTINYSGGSFMNVAVANNAATVNGLSAGTFNDLTITISGCTSTEDVDVTLTDPAIPTLAATGNDPTTCGGTDGSIDFMFTNVADGNYTINYSGGSFMNVAVANNAATVNGLSAGTFNNLTITVNNCTSTEDVDIVLSDSAIPTLAATGNNPTTCGGTDGSIDFMFTNVPDGNYTINYAGGSFTNVTVANNMATVIGLSAGVFNDLTITVSNCISTEDVDITLAAPTTPTLAAAGNDPTTCGGTEGSIDFTFTNVPDGSYTINYNGGSFTGVTVSNNMATVGGLSAGTFNDLTITVNNCTSTEDVDVTLEDPITFAGAGLLVNACNDQGTSGNSNDDTFTFSLEPNGVGIGATYSVSGDVTQNNISYGVATLFDNSGNGFLITNGVLNLIISDDANPSCQLMVTVTPPASCSNCSISINSLFVTDESCDGANDGIIDITAISNQGTVEYSIDNGMTFQVSGTFTALTPTTYNVIARSVSDPTCTTSTIAIINNGPSITINSVVPTNASCNAAADGSITVNATGVGTLEYSIGGAFQTSNVFNGLAANTYTITIREQNTPACSTTTTGTVGTDSEVMITNVATTDEICGGANDGSITITASGSTNLEYSIGGAFQTSNMFTGLAPNTYTITVRKQGAATCTATTMATIDPQTDAVAPMAVCQDITITLSTIDGTATIAGTDVDNGSSDNCGIVTYTVSQTDFDCTNLAGATVTLTVEDANGNSDTCNAFVNVLPSSFCIPPTIGNEDGPMISDPCTCRGDGAFDEEAVVDAGSGQIWTVVSTTLLDPATNQPYPAGTILMETPQGGGASKYSLAGIHLDGVGYELTVDSPSNPGASLSVGNTCFYATANLITDLSGEICLNTAPITLMGEGSDPNGTIEFTVDGVVTNIIDPSALGVGTFPVVFTFDAGDALGYKLVGGNVVGPPDGASTIAEAQADPGCEVVISSFITITSTPSNMACNDVIQASLNENCEAEITADMILEGSYGCFDDYEISMQNGFTPVANPLNATHIGQDITVTITHIESGNSCWGTVTIEDKLAPEITCNNLTINCDDDLPFVGVGISANDNCFANPTIQMTNEVFTDNDICDGNDKVIVRTFIAIDNFGNESQPCNQTITIERIEANFPEDIVWSCEQYENHPNIIDGTFLTCNVTTPNPGGGLDATGVSGGCLNTTGSGYPFETLNDMCNYAVSFTDEILPTCDQEASLDAPVFKIVRTWTVLDWCTNTIITSNNSGDNIQVIKVSDITNPVIVMNPITVSANIAADHPNPCTSQEFIPAPTELSDDCSGIASLAIFTDAGELEYIGNDPMNGGNIPAPGLAVGTHIVTYVATDFCGNITELPVTLTVVDDIAPVAVCDELTTVSLTSSGNGLTIVDANEFDDGSSDNCCIDHFEVRRMEDNCGNPSDLQFGPNVTFCCEDITASPIMVAVRVVDCYDNSNECMVEVIVEDKLNPIVTLCPANQTITCDDYWDNLETDLLLCEGEDVCEDGVLNNFGSPEFYDNCGFDVTPVVNINIDQCGDGSITRQWSAEDPSGNVSTTCTQIISVEHVSDWAVMFPDDIFVDCGNDVPDFGEPILYFETCELLAVSFEDELYTAVPDACYKLVRQWSVINWCTVGDEIAQEIVEPSECDANIDYNGNGINCAMNDPIGNNGTIVGHGHRTFREDANTPDGYITYEQVIKVNDTVAPVFTSCPDKEVCIFDGCEIDIQLDQPEATDCSEEISYEVDPATTNLPNGSGFGLYTNVVPGTYSVTYKATDNCGNWSVCEATVTVSDCKNPTPYCEEGLVISLMNTNPPMVDVWAADFDAGSFDNCGVKAVSFSPDINDTQQIFFCEDLGEQEIELWITDIYDNQDFCVTTVEIQVGTVICDDELVVIAGEVATEENETVADVEIHINGTSNFMEMTGTDGEYSIEVPTGGDYTVVPLKDVNPLNGVTTFDLVKISKHILNIEPLGSPYKIIAADANKSNSVTTFDLVEIRKLILLINTNYSNNTSWRFVDKDFEFTNPANPFADVFPESTNLNNLQTAALMEDFVAIKIGDVNNSNNPNQLLAGDDRNFEGNLTLTLQNQIVRKGQQLAIDFRAKDFAHFGYQFTLDFENSALDFIEIKEGLAKRENFGLSFIEEGIMTTSWHNPTVVEMENEILFTLILEAKADGMLENLISLSPNYTPSEAYTLDGEIQDINLEFENSFENLPFELFQNQPNPFNERTTIGFVLPENGKATLTISDLSGKVIFRKEGNFEQGFNQIQIENNDLPVGGVLYYQLETGTNAATRKMILLK